MKTEFLKIGSRPNGYFGDRINGAFCFDVNSGATLFVYSGGFIRDSIPLAVDSKEAVWLLENHPSSRFKGV